MRFSLKFLAPVATLLIFCTLAQAQYKNASITVELPGPTTKLQGIKWPPATSGGMASMMGELVQGPVSIKWPDGKQSKITIRGQFNSSQSGGIITRVTLYLSYDNTDFKSTVSQLQKALAALPFTPDDKIKADLAKWQAYTPADLKTVENSLSTSMQAEGYDIQLNIGVQTNLKKVKVYAPDLTINARQESLAKLSANAPELPTLKQTGNVTDMCFSADGKLLATTNSKMVNIWDTATRTIKTTLTLPGRPWCLTLSADGNKLDVGYYEEKPLEIWDLAASKVIATVPLAPKQYTGCFSPNLAYAAVISGKDVIVLDLATGKETMKVAGQSNGDPSAVFSPDSHQLAIAEKHQRTVRLYNLPNNAPIKEFHPKGIYDGGLFGHAIFSPNGKSIAVTAMTGLFVFDAAGGKDERLWLITDVGQTLAYLPDNNRLVSGTWRATGMEHVNIVDLTTHKPIRSFGPFKQCIQKVAVDPAGKYLAIARTDVGDVYLVDLSAK